MLPLSEEAIKHAAQTDDLGGVYEVRIRGHGLTHIRGLGACTRLRSLDLACNRIERVEGLAGNADLRELQLFNNRISGTLEAGALAAQARLERLLLHMNRIEAVGDRAFAALVRLRTLRLDHNRLAAVGDLAGCASSLTSLDLTNNPLRSLAGLPQLPKLAELRASYTEVGTADAVDVVARRCPELVELHLCHTAVDSVSSLAALRHIRVLALDGCPIPGLDKRAFREMHTLRELRVRGCKAVDDLSAVPKLFPALESLDASNCSVAAVESVLSLAKLRSLEELFLTGNPVCAGQPQDAFAWRVLPVLKSLHVLNDMAVHRSGVGLALEMLPERPGTASHPPSTASAPGEVRMVEQQSSSSFGSRPSTSSAPATARPPLSARSSAAAGGTPRASAGTPRAVPGVEQPIAAPVLAPANSADVLAARVMTPMEFEGLLALTLGSFEDRIGTARKTLSRGGQRDKAADASPKKKRHDLPQQRQQRQQASPTGTQRPPSSARLAPIEPRKQQKQAAKREPVATSTESTSKPVPPLPPPPLPSEAPSDAVAVASDEGETSAAAATVEDRTAHKRGPLTLRERTGYHRFKPPGVYSSSSSVSSAAVAIHRRRAPQPQLPVW